MGIFGEMHLLQRIFPQKRIHVHVMKCEDDLNRKEGEQTLLQTLLGLEKHSNPILQSVEGIDEEFINNIMTSMKKMPLVR